MLERIINPKNAEKKPWEMFFIGVFYAILSLILVDWIFSGDPVLSKYRGILVVTFCVMFSIPYIHYSIRNEEKKDLKIRGLGNLIKEHSKVLICFLFLFIGFVVAFSFWYIGFSEGNQSFRVQIETYCVINQNSRFNQCVTEHGVGEIAKTTGLSTSTQRIFNIFLNNINVLVFTLIFSLIFGAGAIFILAWNASVIGAAIGIFSKSSLSNLPLGLARYMIHGIPEIAAYFVGAIAGGIISVAIIRHDMRSEKFWVILQDSLNLFIIAILILVVAALMEVFITPMFF
jgi:uncharacterized membrane protein SpoIIM required for sporulation